MSTRLNVAVLAVADLESSLRFYVSGLGFHEILRAEPASGRHWVELGSQDSTGRIALINAEAWGTSPRSGPVLTLACDDLERLVRDLEAVGASPTPPAPTPWGLSAQVSDPDAALIILGQAAEPAS